MIPDFDTGEYAMKLFKRVLILLSLLFALRDSLRKPSLSVLQANPTNRHQRRP